MNPAQLLEHFERIGEAPDSVARLRRFILDLAVRGKLVGQDPEDEPAGELLKRITAISGRQAIIGRGQEDQPAFVLPSGWAWSRVGLITSKTGSGSTPRGGQSVYQSIGIPFLRSQNVYNDGLRLNDVAYINQSTHTQMRGTTVEPGDLLLNITGGSIGRCCLIPDDPIEANISQHVAIIRLAETGMRKFMHKVVLSPFFQSFVIDEQTGAGRGGLPKNRMDQIPVPLPPLAEQHRIVAKVDELMALCDQLETAKNEREARRDRLVAASLHRIGTAPAEAASTDDETATALSQAARFHLNHLPRLTTRHEHIKQLRQTILNLAIRGRLVPQDPNDEPAAELLNEIDGEVNAKPNNATKVEIQHCTLPDGWIWISLGRLVIHSDAGWSPNTENHPRSGTEWGVLKVSAVSWDTFRPWENKQVLPGTEPKLQAQVKSGDFLISRANTAELIARAVIVDDEPINLMMSDKIVRLRLVTRCDSRYVWMVNNYADFAREHYVRHASGVSPSMKNVSRDVIMGLPFPLPPLAEQHRIVAKVDELMALCAQLEAQLTATQTDSRRLLEAVLRDALSPAMEEVAA